MPVDSNDTISRTAPPAVMLGYLRRTTEIAKCHTWLPNCWRDSVSRGGAIVSHDSKLEIHERARRKSGLGRQQATRVCYPPTVRRGVATVIH
jgi:hypothetical protein